MKDEILKRGYKQLDMSDQFTKNDWTIRIYKDIIEAYNNPDKAPGRYYTVLLNKLEINDLLDEIDDFIKLR